MRATHSPAVDKREILMCSLEYFALKMYEKTWMQVSRNIRIFGIGNDGPRIISFLSFGIPDQSELRPSTMSRHSSRASRSDLSADSRYARRLRMQSSGDDGAAGGISRTRRDRTSPKRVRRSQFRRSCIAAIYSHRWTVRPGHV